MKKLIRKSAADPTVTASTPSVGIGDGVSRHLFSIAESGNIVEYRLGNLDTEVKISIRFEAVLDTKESPATVIGKNSLDCLLIVDVLSNYLFIMLWGVFSSVLWAADCVMFPLICWCACSSLMMSSRTASLRCTDGPLWPLRYVKSFEFLLSFDEVFIGSWLGLSRFE